MSEPIRNLWSCPNCAFTFDAGHDNADGSGYSCPVCAEARLTKEVAELRQVLADDTGKASRFVPIMTERIRELEQQLTTFRTAALPFVEVVQTILKNPPKQDAVYLTDGDDSPWNYGSLDMDELQALVAAFGEDGKVEANE